MKLIITSIRPAYKAMMIERFFNIFNGLPKKFFHILAGVLFFVAVATPSLAQQLSAQDIRLLCSGLGSSTASGNNAMVSIGGEGLRATTNEGELSIYQGDELLLQIDDFSFESYTDCIVKILRDPQESQGTSQGSAVDTISISAPIVLIGSSSNSRTDGTFLITGRICNISKNYLSDVSVEIAIIGSDGLSPFANDVHLYTDLAGSSSIFEHTLSKPCSNDFSRSCGWALLDSEMRPSTWSGFNIITNNKPEELYITSRAKDGYYSFLYKLPFNDRINVDGALADFSAGAFGDAPLEYQKQMFCDCFISQQLPSFCL